jgi:hypothetical protein
LSVFHTQACSNYRDRHAAIHKEQAQQIKPNLDSYRRNNIKL